MTSARRLVAAARRLVIPCLLLLPMLLLSACTLAPIRAPAPAASGAPSSAPPPQPAQLESSADEILIPAGPFQMGCTPDGEACQDNAGPLHEVTLDAYLIDSHEVTIAAYAACVDAGACTPPHALSSRIRPAYYGAAAFSDYPVVNVDWYQAVAFCTWQGKRLPTEAEWEKAARGSADARIYPWGDQPPDCTRLNGWDAATNDSCIGDTTAVGSYPAGASPWGLMDMGGNVWEWVNDWYLSDAYTALPADNPVGPATGLSRVFRGGSWYDMRWYVRVSYRIGDYPERWADWLGFRCARKQ